MRKQEIYSMALQAYEEFCSTHVNTGNTIEMFPSWCENRIEATKPQCPPATKGQTMKKQLSIFNAKSDSMQDFWNWMKCKKVILSEHELSYVDPHSFVISKTGVIYKGKKTEHEKLPLQMLIGYMIEYLIYKERPIDTSTCGNGTIKDVYNSLRWAIEEEIFQATHVLKQPFTPNPEESYPKGTLVALPRQHQKHAGFCCNVLFLDKNGLLQSGYGGALALFSLDHFVPRKAWFKPI